MRQWESFEALDLSDELPDVVDRVVAGTEKLTARLRQGLPE